MNQKSDFIKLGFAVLIVYVAFFAIASVWSVSNEFQNQESEFLRLTKSYGSLVKAFEVSGDTDQLVEIFEDAFETHKVDYFSILKDGEKVTDASIDGFKSQFKDPTPAPGEYRNFETRAGSYLVAFGQNRSLGYFLRYRFGGRFLLAKDLIFSCLFLMVLLAISFQSRGSKV